MRDPFLPTPHCQHRWVRSQLDLFGAIKYPAVGDLLVCRRSLCLNNKLGYRIGFKFDSVVRLRFKLYVDNESRLLNRNRRHIATKTSVISSRNHTTKT